MPLSPRPTRERESSGRVVYLFISSLETASVPKLDRRRPDKPQRESSW